PVWDRSHSWPRNWWRVQSRHSREPRARDPSGSQRPPGKRRLHQPWRPVTSSTVNTAFFFLTTDFTHDEAPGIEAWVDPTRPDRQHRPGQGKEAVPDGENGSD
ncbi:hypothetical protein T310_9118, partial [Rasamsonia emersonii CBS 393.64]